MSMLQAESPRLGDCPDCGRIRVEVCESCGSCGECGDCKCGDSAVDSHAYRATVCHGRKSFLLEAVPRAKSGRYGISHGWSGRSNGRASGFSHAGSPLRAIASAYLASIGVPRNKRTYKCRSKLVPEFDTANISILQEPLCLSARKRRRKGSKCCMGSTGMSRPIRRHATLEAETSTAR